jgi:hypothetical protein
MTVAATGAAVPSVTNTATVTSASFDVNAANNTASDVTVVLGPNLSTSTKSVVDLNGGEADAGDTLRYTITLVESAGLAASGVSAVTIQAEPATSRSSIPPGAMNASTGAGTGANGTGRVNIGNIFVPGERRVAIVRRAHRGGHDARDADRQHGDGHESGGLGATPAARSGIVSLSAIPSSGEAAIPAQRLWYHATRTPPSTDAPVTLRSTLVM